MSDLPKMISHFDRAFSISLEVPEHWTAAETDDFPLVFLAPAEDGYRSNLGFSKTKLGPLTQERLEQAIEDAKAQQLAEYDRFKQLDESKFWLAGRPAYLQRYEWHPEGTNYHFSQVLAILVVDQETVYEINGSTLKHLAQTYIPIFEHVIRSIRLIPRA